jgi:SAM-dependent methyltransferase
MDLHDFPDVAQNYDHYVNAMMTPDHPCGSRATIDFHLELARTYGSGGVLDIGCGTGLTAIPLAEQGFAVTAIDISPPMIDVLNAKAAAGNVSLRSICAGMEDFDAGKENSLAFIARTGFLHLLTPEAQRRGIANIHRHLAPGGIFSFNTSYPHHGFLEKAMASNLDDYSLRVTYTNKDGNTEKVYTSAVYDPETQVMSNNWRFEEYRGDRKVDERVRPLRIRMSFRRETEYLLELAGFRILNVYGDYRKSEPRYPSWLVWVAQKV